MAKNVNIKFELNYNIDDLRFMVGEDFPEEQFTERVTEQVWADFARCLEASLLMYGQIGQKVNDYEQGFYDARDSVVSLIDEWYEVYQEQVDLMPTKIAIGFLKKAISDADVLDAE